MNENPFQSIGDAAVVCALAGAREYLRERNLTATPEALSACCSSWAKIELPGALRDAKEAMACGMVQAAEATFKASMILAGIKAAKEVGCPA